MTAPAPANATEFQWPRNADDAWAIHNRLTPMSRLGPIRVGRVEITDSALECEKCNRMITEEHLRAETSPSVFKGMLDMTMSGVCPHCETLVLRRERLKEHNLEIISQLLSPDQGVVASITTPLGTSVWRQRLSSWIAGLLGR